MKRLTAVLGTLAVAVSLGAYSAPGEAHPGHSSPKKNEGTYRKAGAMRAHVTLSPVGTRRVNKPIPVKGYLSSNYPNAKKRLVLQQRVNGRWVNKRSKVQRKLGPYTLGSIVSHRSGTVPIRVRVFARGRLLDNSVVRRVAVKPTTYPGNTTEQRTIDGSSYCQQLYVNTLNQQRTVGWRWTGTKWVSSPGAWRTTSSGKRPAAVQDCVHLLDSVPANASLPDLRIQSLVRCGRGDADATGNKCFSIIPSAPLYPDFPSLEGRKLLKFPVITMNVPVNGSGQPAPGGPAEIIADRSGSVPSDWKAYQTFYDSNGARLGSVVDPNVEFYFAGDGHNHWHVKDFDDYYLLNAAGNQVAVAEKHGYCMQDNKTYDPWFNEDGTSFVPGVPAEDLSKPSDQLGVYWETTSCGKGLPNALTIVHGLSKGWGDTYPTTLPDQAIDITDVEDGVYTVQIHADAKGAVVESNNDNNIAHVKIRITGNQVDVICGSWGGGLIEPAYAAPGTGGHVINDVCVPETPVVVPPATP